MKWRMLFVRFVEDTRMDGHEETVEVIVDIPADFKPLSFEKVEK